MSATSRTPQDISPDPALPDELAELKQAQASLRQEKALLQSVMNGALTCHLAYLDCDFTFVCVNETYARGCGYAAAELIGQNHFALFPDEENLSIFRQVRDTGEAVEFRDKPFRFPDQPQRGITYWDWTLLPVKDELSRVRGLVLSLVETTERKRSEEAMREREKHIRLKLESILAPSADIANLELSDILDVPAVQSLMESFHRLTGIPVGILDLEGRILVGVGWQEVCTRFHRKNPVTCGFCRESDTQLTAGVAEGEFKLYKCKNNMWDVATPIIIGGQHMGNLFSGQFFFQGETLDHDLFRERARLYGFPQEEYLSLLDQVPRFTREEIASAMAYLTELAGTISRLSYANIQLARSVASRDALTNSLRQNREELNRAQAVAHTGSWRLDVRNNDLRWSDESYRIFDIPIGTSMTYEAFLERIHTEDRAFVDDKWMAALAGAPYDIEHRIVTSDGIKWVREKAELEFDGDGALIGGFGVVQDITERKEYEQALRRAKDEWEATFNSVPDLIAIIDKDHKVVRANRAMSEKLKCSPDDCIGTHCYKAVHGTQAPPACCPHAKTLADGCEHTVEVNEKVLGGDFLVTTTPLLDADGKSIGSVHVARDITARKKVEEALRKAHDELERRVEERTAELATAMEALGDERQRFNDVLDAIPAYVVLLDKDYQVPFANRFFRERFGESNGRRCYEYLFNRQEPCEICETYQVLKTMAPHHWEWLGPDGRNYDVHDYPFTDADGSVKILEMGIDITERKRAEEALRGLNETLEQRVLDRTEEIRRHREWLSVTLHSIGDAVIACDVDGLITFMNPVGAALTGWNADEAMGLPIRSVFRILCEKTNAPAEDIIHRVLHEGAVVSLANHTALVRRDGSMIPIEDSAAPIKDSQGNVSGVVLVFHDVTEKRDQQQALENLVARFELLAETSATLLQAREPQAIVQTLCTRVMHHLDCSAFFNFLVDEQAGRLRLNACAGIAEEEANHIEWLDYGTAVCGCAARDACRIVAEHIPSTPDPRTELVKSYGIKAYACHPLLGPGGKVLGTLSFGTSSRETFSEKDLSLMKAVADLVSVAMQRIRSQEALAQARDELEIRVKERTAEAEQRAQQLQALTRQLTHAEEQERRRLADILHDDLQQVLIAARCHLSIMTNRVDKSHRPFLIQVDELIDEAVSKSRSLSRELNPPILQQAGLVPALEWLATQMEAKHGMTISVMADPHAEPNDQTIKTFIYKSVQELLLNVIKHAGTNQAEVSLLVREGNLHLVVSDEGCGFDPAKTTVGAGLGLFNIQERLRNLGGQLTVTSKTGDGSLFELMIPLQSEENATGTAKGSTRSRTAHTKTERIAGNLSTRVLVADDHKIVREGLLTLLAEHEELEVVGEASNGREAVQLAQEFQPDVIIMDLYMPEMTGFEATPLIKQMLPETRIIAFSMLDEEGIEERLKQAGFERYVSKAAPSEELIEVILPKK